MTLTLHLQISFEVIAYILNKGIMWVKYEAEWSKGREDILRTRIFKNIILLWPSQFLFTENRFKVTTHPFTLYSNALLMWSLSQIRVSRNYICSQKRIFAWSDMIFHPLPRNFMQGHCTSINDRDSLWVLARLDQREKRYAPDKDFIYIILLWP